MRVTIEHLDKHEIQEQGWFRTKTKVIPGNWVKIFIQLSNEENAVIQRHDLAKYILHSEPNPEYPKFQKYVSDYYARYGKDDKIGPGPEHAPPEILQMPIRWFLNPNGFWRNFETPSDAKNWAGELRSLVQRLKEIIEHNATPPKTETFDL